MLLKGSIEVSKYLTELENLKNELFQYFRCLKLNVSRFLFRTFRISDCVKNVENWVNCLMSERDFEMWENICVFIGYFSSK